MQGRLFIIFLVYNTEATPKSLDMYISRDFGLRIKMSWIPGVYHYFSFVM